MVGAAYDSACSYGPFSGGVARYYNVVDPHGGSGPGGPLVFPLPALSSSPRSCLAQALSGGRGVALALDAIGDVATAALLLNPASTTALAVGAIASSLGARNSLYNAGSLSSLALPFSAHTVTTVGFITSGSEMTGLYAQEQPSRKGWDA